MGTVEVETSESVNHLEARAQWAHLGRAKAPFHLYVPAGSVEMARRLATENDVHVSEIWSYHTLGDQTRFTLVHRAPTPTHDGPRREPSRAEPAAKPAPAAKKRAAAAPKETDGRLRRAAARRGPRGPARRARPPHVPKVKRGNNSCLTSGSAATNAVMKTRSSSNRIADEVRGSRVLYWFRTPPGIKVGRSALDEDAIRLLEELNPDVEFDWTRILKAEPPPQEPRRASRAPVEGAAATAPEAARTLVNVPRTPKREREQERQPSAATAIEPARERLEAIEAIAERRGAACAA